MRILHVYKTYLPDNFEGIARIIFEIAEGVRDEGIESEVLSLSERPEPPSVAIAHHLSHRAHEDLHIASTGLSLSVFSRFRALAREADLIHYHFPWPVGDLLHLTMAGGKPAIVTYHSDVVRQKALARLYAPLMHRFLGRLDAIVATSPNYIETSPVLQRYRAKLSMIPLGISEAAPVSPERLAGWRARLGPRFLLFVGALRYYKGLPFLIEAARATGLPVVVAGGGELADELARTRPDNLTPLGPVEEADKDALLALCDGFIFPSHLRSEAFGVSLLEAARAGKPMISCEIGTGTSYVNIDGETGLVVPPADAAALGGAMRALWDDAEGAAAMGRRARQRYEALFTGARMAGAYASLYRKTLASRTR